MTQITHFNYTTGFMRRSIISLLPLLVVALPLNAQGRIENIKYGDFNQWVTRHIHESGIIGGKEKTVYAIGPTADIDGNIPYKPQGGSPWATSNVYAKVSGVTKGSNAVFPCQRTGSDRCAKLSTRMEQVKVLGLLNMNVMVAGSIFLGKIYEPISSTKNPYAKMDMGIPFAQRPDALMLDYKVDMPNVDTRVKSSGFGGQKTLKGHDNGVVFIFLQRRWEDADGNLHACRVGTGGRLFTAASPWVNGHKVPIVYGDASAHQGYAPYMALRDKSNAYYALNSKGKLKPVIEEGWDDPSATPTHVIVMISAGSGEPYVGTEGLNLYVDNVAWAY